MTEIDAEETSTSAGT